MTPGGESQVRGGGIPGNAVKTGKSLMKSFSRHKLFIFSIVVSLMIHIASLSAHIPGLPLPLSTQILTARLYSDQSRDQSAESGLPGPKITSAQERTKLRGEGATTTPKETPAPKKDAPLAETKSRQDVTDATDIEDKAAAEEAISKADDELAANQQPADASEVLRSISERLNFDIFWMGIFVGVSQLETAHDGETFIIRSETHSGELLSTFYKVEDYVESRIVDGRVATFKIRQREGKYRSNKEVIFNPDNKTVTYIDHLKNKKKEHPMTESALWDVISAFYYVRTQPLIVGQTVYLNVFDSNKFLTVEVYVLAKEKVSLSDGRKVDTVKIRPVLKSDGIFRKKGDILIWLTDDTKRTPVRVETEVPVGKVVAQLKDFKQ
jgi:hypothetical protein